MKTPELIDTSVFPFSYIHKKFQISVFTLSLWAIELRLMRLQHEKCLNTLQMWHISSLPPTKLASDATCLFR